MSLVLNVTRLWWERRLRNINMNLYARIAEDIRRKRLMAIDKVIVTTTTLSEGTGEIKEQKTTVYGYFCDECHLYIHPTRVEAHAQEHL